MAKLAAQIALCNFVCDPTADDLPKDPHYQEYQADHNGNNYAHLVPLRMASTNNDRPRQHHFDNTASNGRIVHAGGKQERQRQKNER